MFTPAVIRQKLHRQMVPGWPLSAVGSADGNLTITAISRFSTDVMNLQREAAPPPHQGSRRSQIKSQFNHYQSTSLEIKVLLQI